MQYQQIKVEMLIFLMLIFFQFFLISCSKKETAMYQKYRKRCLLNEFSLTLPLL